jgi:AcrR family transcriptional regulator
MPIQVDITQRRRDIAEATFRVAAREGLRTVTIRSVAAELGASTTVITNYLPTRAELLLNAVDLVTEEWLAELREVVQTQHGEGALREVMRRTVVWNADERLRCQFWVAVLALPDRTAALDAHLAASQEAVRSLLAKVVGQCGHPDPGLAADMLFLFAQGTFVSMVEAESEWPEGRIAMAAEAAVEAVLTA